VQGRPPFSVYGRSRRPRLAFIARACRSRRLIFWKLSWHKLAGWPHGYELSARDRYFRCGGFMFRSACAGDDGFMDKQPNWKGRASPSCTMFFSSSGQIITEPSYFRGLSSAFRESSVNSIAGSGRSEIDLSRRRSRLILRVLRKKATRHLKSGNPRREFCSSSLTGSGGQF
jgi:hypothetical protein